MVQAASIEVLERTKQRTIRAVGLTAAVLLILLGFRFIPRLNEALSGRPEYVRVLTETFGRQFAAQTQMQIPIIVEHDEHGTCSAANRPSVPDDEVRGTIYLLTYSEQQHLTCITTYVVPVNASKFPSLRSITPEEGKNYGPRLFEAIKAFAETRIIRVYAAEYLKRLHWRYTPHFPLSPSEAESLRSQSYYSGAKQPGNSVSVDLDYGELRAEVAKRHRKVNYVLSVLLVSCGALSLLLLRKLALVYRVSSQQCRVYQLTLTPRTFLMQDMATKLTTARREYFERQQQAQARSREEEKLLALRHSWQESLRSALLNLKDEQLRSRVQQFLEAEPQDLDQMRSLWVEVQEQTGAKTPADKLNLLLESAKPYCTEEEFLAGRAEAFSILNKFGFRAARAFAITLHDQFRTRARETEELESSRQTIV